MSTIDYKTYDTAEKRKTLDTEFDVAVALVSTLPKSGPVQPTQDDQLKFYAYFKVATTGHLKPNTPRPGMFDLSGKYKWDAWNTLEVTTVDEAKQGYVDELKRMLNDADDEESKGYLKELEEAATRSG